MSLTDLQIQRLPTPPKGQKTHFDTAVKGFGVRVSTGGTKSFVVIYGTARRRKTLGRYPDMSLKEARRAAQAVLDDQTPRNRPLNLSEARTAFLRECQDRLRPKTYAQYVRYLNRVDVVEVSDVTTNKVDLTHVQTVATWKAFFNWCIRNEIVDRNPFRFIEAKNGTRERVLKDDEIKAIWAHTAQPFSDILKLLLLTGQRRSQWGAFDPKWIDEDTIVFPPDQMKGKQSHTIPITPLVHSLLPSEPFNYTSWSKAKKRIDKETGITDWVIHDLRRTAATKMIELEISVPTVEAILAHRSGTISGVAAIYIRHSFLREMRVALAKYETHISELVGLRL